MAKSNQNEAIDYIDKLRAAVDSKDKRKIIELYDNDTIDWEAVSYPLFDKYNKLIDLANDIVQA